jgi:hypothetical protein
MRNPRAICTGAIAAAAALAIGVGCRSSKPAPVEGEAARPAGTAPAARTDTAPATRTAPATQPTRPGATQPGTATQPAQPATRSPSSAAPSTAPGRPAAGPAPTSRDPYPIKTDDPITKPVEGAGKADSKPVPGPALPGESRAPDLMPKPGAAPEAVPSPSAQPSTAEIPAPAGTIEAPAVKQPKSRWSADGFDKYRVGDFVEYDTETLPGLKTHLRKEILSVGDHRYTELVTTTISGAEGTKTAIKTTYEFTEADAPADLKDLAKDIRPFDDKVTVNGRELKAIRKERYDNGKLVNISWYSTEVPLDGLVKTEGPDKKLTLQLVDFGRK